MGTSSAGLAAHVDRTGSGLPWPEAGVLGPAPEMSDRYPDKENCS